MKLPVAGRALAALGLAGCALAVGYALLPKNTEPDPASLPEVVVAFRDGGYEPAEITVRAGQRVRWVNESSLAMWPASAIHPTHSLYPQKSANDCLGSSFDACRALPPGESWSFTFSAEGSWRYHDHIHASKTGVVNVVR